MTKLSQLLAVEKGVKARTQSAFTKLYHAAQKPVLWEGITRTYAPKDDEGDQLPSESVLVQATADEYLAQARETLTRLYDVVATKDRTNMTAVADVVVDGQTILTDVPATTLIFLEKQLTDLRTVVDAIPTLSLASQWEGSDLPGVHQTLPAQTHRTVKVPRNHVRAVATDKFPAQVDVYNEDVIVGYWTTRKLSGGLSVTRKTTLLRRIDALADAVKQAREQANTVEVVDSYVGKKIFDFVLGA